MLIIGEKINGSRSSIAEAIAERDEEFIANLARAQADAGADFIDVNAGTGHGSREQERADMEWLVKVVQSATDKPLAIDSDTADVIEAALGSYRGEKIIINSVTAEPEKLESIGPLAAERQAWLVALAMGAGGIPDNVEKRLEACKTIMAYLSRLGMEENQVFFDPLALPVSVNSDQALVTLKTIEGIKSRFPAARTVMGVSNVSYGLPNRKLVNRAFLLMAAYAGLDAAIIDPLDAKAMSLVKAGDLLAGKDPSSRGFIRAYRKGIIVD